MPTPYPIQTLIDATKGASVLAQYDIQKHQAFRGGSIDTQLGVLLNMEADILDWLNTNQPNYSEIENIANYCWWLAEDYGILALGLIGEQRGGVIEITTGQATTFQWVTNSFTVGLGSPPVLAGESVFTVIDSIIIFDSVAFGYSGGSPLPRTGTVPAGQTSYSVAYSQSGITITLSYPVSDDEQYTLTYVKNSVGQVSGAGSGAGLPLPFKEGEFLTNDGADALWESPVFSITSIDFESDGITYLGASHPDNPNLDIHGYDIYLNEANRFLVADEFTRISGGRGGFVILIDGFDATTISYLMKISLKGVTFI